MRSLGVNMNNVSHPADETESSVQEPSNKEVETQSNTALSEEMNPIKTSYGTVNFDQNGAKISARQGAGWRERNFGVSKYNQTRALEKAHTQLSKSPSDSRLESINQHKRSVKSLLSKQGNVTIPTQDGSVSFNHSEDRTNFTVVPRLRRSWRDWMSDTSDQTRQKEQKPLNQVKNMMNKYSNKNEDTVRKKHALYWGSAKNTFPSGEKGALTSTRGNADIIEPLSNEELINQVNGTQLPKQEGGLRRLQDTLNFEAKYHEGRGDTFVNKAYTDKIKQVNTKINNFSSESR
ncbi:MAG: hypothetical protein ACJAZS_000723 [Alteromonas naphthalenivorans]|jgi:hypothetical protein